MIHDYPEMLEIPAMKQLSTDDEIGEYLKAVGRAWKNLEEFEANQVTEPKEAMK